MVSNITLNDVVRFNELGLLVNNNFINVYKLNDLLESDYDYLYGFYIEGNLVAFIHINKLYENMDIVNVVVDFDFRNKGIAGLLIEYVIDSFSDVESILLEVNENNIAAISLYKKYGFEVISKRKKYYGNADALIMKRVGKNEGC
jgi:ribosomal-protein-alanine N-acetyltransferase